jgi:HEAT repeat protein
MLITKILKYTILASVLFTASVMALTPYEEGQKALRTQNWNVAAEEFQKAIKSSKNKADAAMYWRAHALYKANRSNEAMSQIKSLERKYPDSRWIKEAQVLKIEHQGADAIAQSAGDSSGLDDDLRIFALAQLMDRDPERALPLVLDALKNTTSESARFDALFVLGMSDSPEAQQMIAEIARDSKDPGLQADAIHMLGAASSESSLALLEGLYTDSASRETKEAVIHAHVAADEQGNLIRFLKTEKDPELQREIIYALGAMDATDELDDLYASLTNKETRVAVLESLAIADDTEGLIKLLRAEKDADLRAAAIHSLSINGDSVGAAYLQSLYPNGTYTEKNAIIESMMVMDDAKGLIALLKQETDPELRREMVQMLTVMDTDESTEFLFEMLENKG